MLRRRFHLDTLPPQMRLGKQASLSKMNYIDHGFMVAPVFYCPAISCVARLYKHTVYVGAQVAFCAPLSAHICARISHLPVLIASTTS